MYSAKETRPKMGQITGQLNSLDATVAELENCVSKLCGPALEGVLLRPIENPPKFPRDVENITPQLVPLANRIREIEERVERQVDKIKDVLERLEL